MVVALEDNVLPLTATLPGFCSARFAWEAATDTNYTYLVFAERADAERFVTISFAERRPGQQAAGVERVGEFAILDIFAEVGEAIAGTLAA